LNHCTAPRQWIEPLTNASANEYNQSTTAH
jgi:hypothetical protein